MRSKFLIIIALILIGGSRLTGQISMTIGYRQATESATSAVPVAIASPQGNVFNTSDLSKQFPNAKIPVEDLVVTYPDLTGALDTVAILWYLKPESYSPKGEVNIILVTIDSDSVKTFYADNNNDRSFGSSEDRFSFSADQEKRVMEIKILGSFHNYTLMNPDYSAPERKPSRTKFYAAAWQKISKKPSLGLDFSLITGGGKEAISTFPTDPDIKTDTYMANIVGAIKPSIGIDFSWLNLHLIGFGAFERLQNDETVLREIVELSDGREFLKRYYSRGTWPTAKFHYGVMCEYDIRIKAIYLTPFASYSKFKIVNEKVFDRSIAVSGDAAYRDLYTKEFGGKIKVPVGEKTMLYIKYAYSRSWFDVSDFINPYEEGSYSVDYYQHFFGLGISYRIF